MNNFKGSVVDALAISGGTKIASQLLSIVFTIWLARLLSPEEFGVLAMIAVFTGVASLLSDVGLGAALIQNRNTTEDHYSSVFWFNGVIGAVMTIVFIVLAPVIADFYNTPIIEPLLGVLAFQFVVSSLALVPQQRLIKHLKFGKIAIANIVAMLLSSILAVHLAMEGFGVWSLAWKSLTQAILVTVIIYSLAHWWPKLRFRFKALKELFLFSVYVLGTELLQYVTHNLDNMIVGRFLGAESTGLLERSKSLKTLPITNVSRVIANVMFPALSLLRDDTARVKAVYLRSIGAIAFVVFPLMIGLMAVADNFIVGLLGQQWSEMVLVFQILCVGGVASSIATVTGSVYQSQGASKLQFHTNLITNPITIALILIGINWGLLGVVIALTASNWISFTITISRAGPLINLTFYELVRPIASSLFMASIMGILTYIVGLIFTNYSEIVTLLVQVGSGVLIYLLLTLGFKPKASVDLYSLIRERVSRIFGR